MPRRGPATRARRLRTVPALAALALAASALGACTSETLDPVAGGSTASAPTALGSGASTAQPDPGMTPIEAAARCTTTRRLTGKGEVPLDAVFPGAETSATSDPKETVPGPDAADRTRCPGELPAEPHCDGLVPWTDLLPDEFVPASGARRIVGGYLLTMPKQAGNQAPPESSAGTKVVTFSLVDLVAGDPGGLVDHLDVAFRACAKATPSTVAGVGALVGTVRSEYGAGSAEVVLLRRGPHLVWAALDGSGWEKGEQQRALAVLVARLL
ncbi:hypothetical protein GCM10009721_29130 [Terrabacter tumescens]|uniref:Uncharacterized protein n=1 Tax=Terrabacter tumescens TaxID=60443 RepID=A0ABQ2I736_9MICO|nr:hypothetical protein GCM10009721_29130 [Terrabacter tumescens]